MFNILFVCYGNICRSPMAEMIMKDLIYKNNKRYKFYCASRATSIEELGNDIYPQAKEILKKNNIKVESHQAKLFQKEDYEKYDYIIVMEEQNKKDLLKIIEEDKENKISLLLDYTDTPKEIADPWYTGNFKIAYEEIYKSCLSLFQYLLKQEVTYEI